MLTTIFLAIGLLILAALSFELVMNGLSASRRLVFEGRRQNLALTEWTNRVDAAVSQARKAETDADRRWAGYRKFVIKRKVYEDPAQTICSFYLCPHDGKALPTFRPGQHLTFEVEVNGSKQIRCYSLSDSYDPDYYRVSIKRVPDGRVSNYFHDQLHEGDILDLKAPGGVFYMDEEENTPIVLIAGGVGITPCLSMLNTLVGAQATREVYFFYASRDPDQVVMYEQLQMRDREFDNVHVHFLISNKEAEVPDAANIHRGRLSLEFFQEILPSSNFKYYMCGPAPMMDGVRTTLAEWGIPVPKKCPNSADPNIHVFWEDFAPPKAAVVVPAGGKTYQITFARSDKTLPWDPESGNLLAFAEANGIAMDSGCRLGSCGACMTAVKDGDVAYDSDPSCDDLQSGCCLACIGRPESDITLDA